MRHRRRDHGPREREARVSRRAPDVGDAEDILRWRHVEDGMPQVTVVDLHRRISEVRGFALLFRPDIVAIAVIATT